MIYNRIITFTFGQIIYFAIIGLVFGLKALLFNFLTSYVALMTFESVNYLEHYGLSRKLLPGADHVYESVRITHSWNAP
jgi:alkane 1-monooxygenase